MKSRASPIGLWAVKSPPADFGVRGEGGGGGGGEAPHMLLRAVWGRPCVCCGGQWDCLCGVVVTWSDMLLLLLLLLAVVHPMATTTKARAQRKWPAAGSAVRGGLF